LQGGITAGRRLCEIHVRFSPKSFQFQQKARIMRLQEKNMLSENKMEFEGE